MGVRLDEEVLVEVPFEFDFTGGGDVAGFLAGAEGIKKGLLDGGFKRANALKICVNIKPSKFLQDIDASNKHINSSSRHSVNSFYIEYKYIYKKYNSIFLKYNKKERLSVISKNCIKC